MLANFSLSSNACINKVVIVIIAGALWFFWVCAIELVVRKRMNGGQLAAKVVDPVDAEVDHSLGLLEEIAAKEVASIWHGVFTNSLKLTIRVLSQHMCTLYGLSKEMSS